MSVRRRSRPLMALCRSLSALVVATLAGTAWAGKSSTTTSTSSTSKTVRSVTPHGYGSTSISSNDAKDGPNEVDAYTFSRDHGHWRNTNGSQEDWEEAQEILDREDGDLFWFRRGSERYLVTDPAALARLADMFAPQEELGRRQGELGRQQGQLGREQGQLGRKQGQLGRIQARLAQKQAALSFRQSAASLSDREDLELEQALEELHRLQDEAGALQAELGEQQGALGERQAALGEKQSALGREQERVSRQVMATLGTFTRELIADGRAKRLR